MPRLSQKEVAEEAGAEERKKMLSASSPLLAGLPLPSTLRSHSATSAILLHTAGRLPLSQLKAAVSLKRSLDAERIASRPSLSSHHPSSSLGHDLDYSIQPDMDAAFEGDDRTTQALLFRQSLAAYAHHEKMLDVNPSRHRIGHAVMTEDERTAMEVRREEDSRAARREERRRDRERTRTEYPSDECPVFIVGQEDTGYVPTWEAGDDAELEGKGGAGQREEERREGLAIAGVDDEDEVVSLFRAHLQRAAVPTIPPPQSTPLTFQAAIERLTAPAPLPKEADGRAANSTATEGSSASAVPTLTVTAPLSSAAAQTRTVSLGGAPTVYVPAPCPQHTAASDALVAALLTPPPPPPIEPVPAPAAPSKTPKGGKAPAKAKAAAAK